ncbi:unnamed protein product (macronuclear) [Paramecium tetraurelia]|uniref:Uncharacterized protein n=1 Tax=Paramecium tetraurelia TaxID=5888 RepID=A0CVA9_PARTE|nr:uncharacterized protein GSPATT00010894001 [Paramecium tetraurelia]CAK74726.1 unnamed protein product [Paramecium tetraurelia]|eukprot:XP_001442123.1 hypothetical protein (macronuclear) [Paramecium tetraurelia strain d4-2]
MNDINKYESMTVCIKLQIILGNLSEGEWKKHQKYFKKKRYTNEISLCIIDFIYAGQLQDDQRNGIFHTLNQNVFQQQQQQEVQKSIQNGQKSKVDDLENKINERIEERRNFQIEQDNWLLKYLSNRKVSVIKNNLEGQQQAYLNLHNPLKNFLVNQINSNSRLYNKIN